MSLDFEYNVILKDYIYFRKYVSNLKIKKMVFIILIKELIIRLLV